ncbi:MAG TPA: phospholipase D family protein, partial [Steroidobacteraceae bacterium]|nr:phospholipase D family protein [Steroidobacteraceae bacterium]
WSTDNIGTLAAEALLRAADRGVKVRVIVDDLLVDAPDASLLALAKHPNIDIRIYNPNSSVGVPLYRKVWNALTDFRGINQRMHDKTFIVDGKIAVTGGRNMAAEYYDYHHDYNFRDRDVLVAGDVVIAMKSSFERFWADPLSKSIESIYGDLDLMQSDVTVDSAQIRTLYRDLHAYAELPSNFAPEVRKAVTDAPTTFSRLAQEAVWGRIDFVSDVPGKNDTDSLGGGGASAEALTELVKNAKKSVLIQSPYLIPSANALELFRQTLKRGVKIRISTNSLASTDNLQAFAGYRNLRDELLEMGVEVFEYRPDAKTQAQVRRSAIVGNLPAAGSDVIFGLHAKTLVVDSTAAFIGTFNLDPRSENLNTEVGVVIHNDHIARAVAAAIEKDMQPENSWNAATDDPDRYVPFGKRAQVRFWQLLPIESIL